MPVLPRPCLVADKVGVALSKLAGVALQDFGMAEGQITVMKQNKVPAMLDAQARFAGAAPLAADSLRPFCAYLCSYLSTVVLGAEPRAAPFGLSFLFTFLRICAGGDGERVLAAPTPMLRVVRRSHLCGVAARRGRRAGSGAETAACDASPSPLAGL